MITDQLNTKFYEKQLQNFFSEKDSEFLINWLTIWFRFSSEKNSEFLIESVLSIFLWKRLKKKLTVYIQIKFVSFCSAVQQAKQRSKFLQQHFFETAKMIKFSKISFEVELDDYTADRIISNIKQAMKKWKKYDFKNDVLWKIFRDEFEIYNENVFKFAFRILLTVFRLFFRKRGVWILLNRDTSIATILTNTFKKKESVRWTNEKMNACHEKKRFTSNQLFEFVKTLEENEMRYMRTKIFDRKNDRRISFLSSSNSLLRHQKRKTSSQQSKQQSKQSKHQNENQSEQQTKRQRQQMKKQHQQNVQFQQFQIQPQQPRMQSFKQH